jgi:hypothetical protein
MGLDRSDGAIHDPQRPIAEPNEISFGYSILAAKALAVDTLQTILMILMVLI